MTMGWAEMEDTKSIQWMHREGSPGYYISVDRRYQILLNGDGRYIVCSMDSTQEKGFQILAGPADSLEEFGVPESMIDEGDEMMISDIVDRAKKGEKVSISIFSPRCEEQE